ncbi:alpha-mannosidase [candidate division KSB1 bacterium]|nr:alpha-mannosidase [candidate division KSB1 bacterium]
MSSKKLFLVCNAHLDPVWLWEWEEGVAATISTFRTAADLCEEFDEFVFNHNEVILYEWIEQYEPALFERIQNLVKKGQWHIMGGWYLQPDCNMPCGESFVRQMMLGFRYFMEKFSVRPRTAINFDPFGHSQGLVQLLAKAGYHSYLFCRPNQVYCHLPADEFIWQGRDGSQILACRSRTHYNSALGKAHDKILDWIKKNQNKPFGLELWGVGNHGGGASRQDLHQLRRLIAEEKRFALSHATPEEFFDRLDQERHHLPVHDADINPWAAGCYTSQARIKQKHRRLENELFFVEKMSTAAFLQALIDYPTKELIAVQKDLATSQFHDILPGSSIAPVEDAAVRLLDHGLEIAAKLKMRAFFALCSGQPRAREDEIPILVYNPHPVPMEKIVECEFNLAMDNRTESYHLPHIFQNGIELPCQVEKELSNLPLEWRKRVVFKAQLEPQTVNRFDCRLEWIPQKPSTAVQSIENHFVIENEKMQLVINGETGLIDRYAVEGVDFLSPNSAQPVVMADSEDPWGHLDVSFRDQIGAFKLCSPAEAAEFAGVKTVAIAPVQIIETGPVRTVVEALLRYNNSWATLRYKIPQKGSQIEIEARVFWLEKDRMLKLAFPTVLNDGEYIGQTAYSLGRLPTNGNEAVAQKWVAVVSEKSGQAMTISNDCIYGSDFLDGEVRLSLLRGAAYSALQEIKEPTVPQDRFTPRIDQGERIFHFWLDAGNARSQLEKIDLQALAHNETPFALSFFPHGEGKIPQPGILLSDPRVTLGAFKRAEDGDGYIIRLYESCGEKRQLRITLPFFEVETEITLQPFEIATLRYSLATQRFLPNTLLEEGLD